MSQPKITLDFKGRNPKIELIELQLDSVINFKMPNGKEISVSFADSSGCLLRINSPSGDQLVCFPKSSNFLTIKPL